MITVYAMRRPSGENWTLLTDRMRERSALEKPCAALEGRFTSRTQTQAAQKPVRRKKLSLGCMELSPVNFKMTCLSLVTERGRSGAAPLQWLASSERRFILTSDIYPSNRSSSGRCPWRERDRRENRRERGWR